MATTNPLWVDVTWGKPLQANKKWQVPNGIAQDMLKSINHEMHSKRGILAFQDATSLQPLTCEDKGLSLKRAAECKALIASRKGGKFVLIDASRVGWSGQPEIFTRLAVRVSTYLRAVRAIGAKDADIVQNRQKAVAIAETKIPDQAKSNLWNGMCQPRHGEPKAKCDGKAKEACRTHVNCKWMPGWQGQEFAEEEFLE